MTIRELAELAQVSPATVSLVLNNKKGVAEETRKRVLELVAEHNYPIPQRGTPKSVPVNNNILFLKYIQDGMVVEENTGFISSIMESIEVNCRKEGYHLNILHSINQLDETLREIEYANFSGVIVLGTELDSGDYEYLNQIPIPYVILDNSMTNFKCHSVVMDNKALVYEAIEHFADLGFREVAYFKSNNAIHNFEERSQAFKEAIQQFNISCKKENEFLITPTLLGAYESMKKYLQQGIKIAPCAFADNDIIAIGVMKALQEYGIRVPEDVSIIGVDDIQFSAIHSPSLSTMSIPKKLMGKLALKVLLEVIEEPTISSIKTYVGGEKIIRESVLS